jgi:DNA-directed RNA polymerase beta' subunit
LIIIDSGFSGMSVKCCNELCKDLVVPVLEGQFIGLFNHHCIHTNKPIHAFCSALPQPKEDGEEWTGVDGKVRIFKAEGNGSQAICKTCVNTSVNARTKKVIVNNPNFFGQATRQQSKQQSKLDDEDAIQKLIDNKGKKRLLSEIGLPDEDGDDEYVPPKSKESLIKNWDDTQQRNLEIEEGLVDEHDDAKLKALTNIEIIELLDDVDDDTGLDSTQKKQSLCLMVMLMSTSFK